MWAWMMSSAFGNPEPLPASYEDVGIDLGVTHFAALSNGAFIDHPRHFRRAEKKLVAAQQAVSRKKKGSHRRNKAAKVLAKLHRKVKHQRKDFHHKPLARWLIVIRSLFLKISPPKASPLPPNLSRTSRERICPMERLRKLD